MHISNKVRLSLAVLAFVGLQGCATHTNKHDGPSVGVSADVDTPIGGVDASVGVHNPSVSSRSNAQPGQYVPYGRIPCGPTMDAVNSPAAVALLNLLSDADPSKVRSRGGISANDSPRGETYNCNVDMRVQ